MDRVVRSNHNKKYLKSYNEKVSRNRVPLPSSPLQFKIFGSCATIDDTAFILVKQNTNPITEVIAKTKFLETSGQKHMIHGVKSFFDVSG